MNIPPRNKKIDSRFLLLIYEQYPSNIPITPENSNTIKIVISPLMISNKPKNNDIIPITEITFSIAFTFFITFTVFKLLPPNKNKLLNFLRTRHIYLVNHTIITMNYI